jgi:hypothetical protein
MYKTLGFKNPVSSEKKKKSTILIVDGKKIEMGEDNR